MKESRDLAAALPVRRADRIRPRGRLRSSCGENTCVSPAACPACCSSCRMRSKPAAASKVFQGPFLFRSCSGITAATSGWPFSARHCLALGTASGRAGQDVPLKMNLRISCWRSADPIVRSTHSNRISGARALGSPLSCVCCRRMACRAAAGPSARVRLWSTLWSHTSLAESFCLSDEGAKSRHTTFENPSQQTPKARR